MINIIPYPKKVIEYSGKCIIPSEVGITNDGFDNYILDAFLDRTQLSIIDGDFIVIKKSLDLNQDFYKINISENKIDVIAGSNESAINALTSLYLLIDNNTLPIVEIEDSPTLKYRGAHLDCSRHFFKINEILKVLEELSLAKINYFHWHLSDDQGFRIESNKYPLLHEKSDDFYSIENIKLAVAFAKSRGIEIIPEIDIPGHTSAMLAAYKELGCFSKEIEVRKKYGIFKEIICPSKNQTIEFIKNLLLDIIPLFPSKYFHIGGDEAPKSEWKACPDCNKKMDELKLDSFNDLQGYFTNQIAKFLKYNGKETIVWSDTLDSNLVTNDIIVQYWEPSRNTKTLEFINNGGKVIYSDMFEYYLDYPYSMTKLKKVYESTPKLKKEIVFDKIYGMEACLWTERVITNENLENKMFPRIYALAERAWGSNKGYKDFEYRLIGLIDKNILKSSYTNPNWWNPKQIKRLKETITYCKSMVQGANIVEGEKPNISIDSIKSFIKKFIL